jgi:hypothetical protein
MAQTRVPGSSDDRASKSIEQVCYIPYTGEAPPAAWDSKREKVIMTTADNSEATGTKDDTTFVVRANPDTGRIEQLKAKTDIIDNNGYYAGGYNILYHEDEDAFYWGGIQYSTDFWKYDFSTNDFTQMASLPNNGYEHATAWNDDKTKLYWAGAGPSFMEYDIAADSWTTLAAPPVAIDDNNALGTMHPVNGKLAFPALSNFDPDVHIYDIGGDSWSTGTAYSGQFSIYYGGYTTLGDYAVKIGSSDGGVYGYDVPNDSWEYWTPAAYGSNENELDRNTVFRKSESEAFSIGGADGGSGKLFSVVL